MKWNFAISGGCLLLLAANIALIHQNSELRSRLSLIPPSLEAAAGTQMPDMHGFDLAGKPIAAMAELMQRTGGRKAASQNSGIIRGFHSIKEGS